MTILPADIISGMEYIAGFSLISLLYDFLRLEVNAKALFPWGPLHILSPFGILSILTIEEHGKLISSIY